jgi:hypothetical protein
VTKDVEIRPLGSTDVGAVHLALYLALVAGEARTEGILRLSLSVNNPNPAKQLYQSLGYVTARDDGDSSVMVLEL